jgi:hypothetical protein
MQPFIFSWRTGANFHPKKTLKENILLQILEILAKFDHIIKKS